MPVFFHSLIFFNVPGYHAAMVACSADKRLKQRPVRVNIKLSRYCHLRPKFRYSSFFYTLFTDIWV